MSQRSIALGILFALLLAGSPAYAGIPGDALRDILIHEQSRNGADGVLAAFIQDKNAEVRARAYRALGRLQDPSLLDAMAKGLSDGVPAVRLEAVFAVGQLFDPVAEPALTAALDSETDPGVKARLVEALGKSGSEAAVPRLAGLLAGSDPGLAQEAALALGALGIRSVPLTSAAVALRGGLASADPEVRWRTAFAVQRGKVAEAGKELERSLKQNDALTLMFSARAAGALKIRAIADLIVPLLNHPEWRVRVEALRALGSIHDPYHTGRASLLAEDPNEHVVLTAIETMGNLAAGGGLGRIEDLEQSNNWRIRAAVLRVQIQGMGDGSVLQVKDAIQETDWRIRAAAAEGLGKIASEQSLLLIESMAADESPQVAAAVVNALTLFPQKEAVEMIRGYLKQGDPVVLAAAAHGAGERHDNLAVPDLLAAYDKLQSPVDTEVMVEIVHALGSILTAKPEDDPIGTLAAEDSTRAIALLEAARHQGDANVAEAAAAALSTITGTTVRAEITAPTGVPAELDLDLALALASGKKKPKARLVTNRGTFVIQLLGEEAPGTVANFVALARKGFYNGLTFHRVVADFVIQGGDPRGDGMGGPGYAIRCEYNPLRYETGMVGMALAGKDTGGSQFFITHSPQPHLNGKYTIFGKVLEGMDVVDTIQVGDLIQEIRLEGI
jgi:peptidylprolyl isomerase